MAEQREFGLPALLLQAGMICMVSKGQALFLRFWYTLSFSQLCPYLNRQGDTKDHLEQSRILEYGFHHGIVFDHVSYHMIFLHELTKSIRVFQHLIQHALVLRIIEHLFRLVRIDCTGDSVHVLRMIDHLVPANAEWGRTIESCGHACARNNLLFRCQNLHRILTTFFCSFLVLFMTTMTVPPYSLDVYAVDFQFKILPLKTSLRSVTSASQRSARSVIQSSTVRLLSQASQIGSSLPWVFLNLIIEIYCF